MRPKSLASSWLAEAGAGAPDIDEAELEALLASMIERGRQRWPALSLSDEQVLAWLGARARTVDALRTVNAEDLFLAAACALGVKGALAAFENECLRARGLAAALKRLDPSPAFADDVRQALRALLFVPAPGQIASFSGRGSLSTWTRVAGVRLALRMRAGRERVVEQVGSQEPAPMVDPELRFLKRKYGAQFERALVAAFARLDHEQHNLLRLQIVDGLRTAQIAALFQLDRSTIKRRLAACREAVFAHVQASMAQELDLSPSSLGSLARLLTSQIDVSLSRLLKQRDADG
jgi:RNA polymerase sigma-70 factor (ECF subfamily)